MANHILTVGSVAFDSITTPFGKVDKTLGGSATYFSLASSLFVPTMIVAVVGSDFKEFDVFKKKKIDISGIDKAKGKTFHWSGKYHYDLNARDTLKTELGVFKDFKPVLDEHHKKAEYVFLGNIHPHLQLDVLKQIKKPKLVGLDTMNFWIEKAPTDLRRVLKLVDVFVINDSEVRLFAKEHNLLKAAGKILNLMGQAPNRTPPVLIIKQGEHGLLMLQSLAFQFYRIGKQKKYQIFNLPGYPLEDVVDPTGAGDSFAGGMFGYLAKTGGLSWRNFKQAAAFGSVLASFCVEDFGTKKLQTLNFKQINKRLTEYKRLIHF